MKKALLALLTLLLCFALFACGEDDSTDDPASGDKPISGDPIETEITDLPLG